MSHCIETCRVDGWDGTERLMTVENMMTPLLTPVCLSGAQRGPEGRAGMENRSFLCWDLSCSRRKATAMGVGGCWAQAFFQGCVQLTSS